MDDQGARSKALDKIRKCLALSESSNENEAASAMRQARALMNKYGLSADDMSIFEVKESTVKIKYKAPPLWFRHLGQVIGLSFGCSLFTKWHHFIFVGPSACAEVAGYSLEVLRRQCEINKAEFLSRDIFRGVSAATKRKAGQAFCEGWVIGVYVVIREFAKDIAEDQKQKHTAYLETITQKTIGESKAPKEKDESDPVVRFAMLHGQAGGQKAQIHAGVAAGEQQLKIGKTY
jgi:hypothetical protein